MYADTHTNPYVRSQTHMYAETHTHTHISTHTDKKGGMGMRRHAPTGILRDLFNILRIS